MSRTHSAPRRGLSAALAGALALALTALAALGLATQANAAFTTGRCAGDDIIGRGASFARDAHDKVFIFNFPNVYCIGTPGFGTINVTYESQGSGNGRRSMKVRNDTPRFGMTDEPPTPAEIAQMNAGTGDDPASSDTIATDNGQIHVVPAAVGAVAPLVNFPDGCDPADLNAESRTEEQNLDGDGTPDDVVRVRFTKTEFEGIWAKDAGFERWNEVFPELTDAACDRPIIRVVRQDDSGTSFAFKDYLNTIDPAEGWLTTYAAGANRTREWPEAQFGSPNDQGCGSTAPGRQADSIDQLTSACASGNDDLTIKLVDTDGSVGYSDISTARNNNPSLAIRPESDDNDIYWTQIPNGSNLFAEPTADQTRGFREDGNKGSNCQAANFGNVPTSTLGDWSQVSGVNALNGYGICTLTYGLVFDDNADVWGNTPGEESKARTVKDYWQNALSDGAQGQLFGNDYAALPAQILALSRAGIDSVDWNKGTGGGGGGDTGGGNPGGGGDTGGGGSAGGKTVSNKFTLPRKTISSKTGGATISVKLPGAGKLVMLATAKVESGGGKASASKRKKVHKRTKTIKVGRVTLNANKAGTFNLTLKPSGAAKKELRKRGKLRVQLRLTFTPKGGSASTSTTSLTLKLKKRKSGKRR